MDTTRLITTAVIWSAVAVMFVGGFAQMSWSGIGGVIWLLGVAALFGSAGYATMWVWKSEKLADGNSRTAMTPNKPLQPDATPQRR